MVERLLETQWVDGGWNCDVTARGDTSSFTESLIPLRAMVIHSQMTGDERARCAAERTAELFLSRHLFKRRSNGRTISAHFIKLHYPCYWHYDILFGLKVMAEGGWIRDPRCNDALDLLESKRLKDGGFPAQEKYYRTANKLGSGRSLVGWGSTGETKMNEFVTADALHVLKAAGRWTTAH